MLLSNEQLINVKVATLQGELSKISLDLHNARTRSRAKVASDLTRGNDPVNRVLQHWQKTTT